jgi:hypothetical protein
MANSKTPLSTPNPPVSAAAKARARVWLARLLAKTLLTSSPRPDRHHRQRRGEVK